MDKKWVVCSDCGYSKEIFGDEVYDPNCELCGGKMELQNKKVEEPLGDNFPIFDQDKQKSELQRLEQGIDKIADIKMAEQEVKNNIEILGESHTWYMIEALSDVNLRLRYRNMFFKLGGNVPEREN